MERPTDPRPRGIDVPVALSLHTRGRRKLSLFDGAAQQGVVVFHLIGALSEYGKLGTVCIGDSHASAEKFYRNTVAVLDRETRQ